MKPWRPLLAGADAERARGVIADVAEALAARPIDVGDAGPSLSRGEPGVGLCFAYLARVLGESTYADQAEVRLTAALERAVATPMGPSLWYGLAGVVWAAEQAMALLDLGGDEDPHAEVDQVLLGILHRTSAPPFELLGGLAGVAVYALERMPRPGARRLLEHVVEALVARATPDGDGVRWVTRFDELTPGEQAVFPDGYCSFGVAHGTPGVLAVLAGAAAWGIGDGAARRAAEAAKRWLWRHRIPDSAVSQFPPLVETPAPHSQPSWCYGDAGIASVLAAAGAALALDEWRASAMTLASSIAARAPARCQLTDANLCHGAVGLGHMLNRLAQRWDRDDLAEAAREWYRRGLAMHRPGEGIGGFITEERDKATMRFEETAFAGLLDGSAGVAMGLAAAVGSVEPIWDRAFLISLRV